ncbi:flagellar associated protein [Dorcoceras hygrometricum]|uniref:Flagellar associated protein n=1 Tax=Dorcoceras hygrometricum TaxID=472368 RepID=A0A2Z7BJN5_9LAMI|nr:flagellar associated protein [Dorcoceras hygrometricum]
MKRRRFTLAPSTAEFRPAGDSELESQEKLTQGLTLVGEIHGTGFTRKLRTNSFSYFHSCPNAAPQSRQDQQISTNRYHPFLSLKTSSSNQISSRKKTLQNDTVPTYQNDAVALYQQAADLFKTTYDWFQLQHPKRSVLNVAAPTSCWESVSCPPARQRKNRKIDAGRRSIR